MFDKKLQELQKQCQEWLEKYAQLEDQSAYIEDAKHYDAVVKTCQQYFERQKRENRQDLEVLRQQHHQWQATFSKPNFLAKTQQLAVVKGAYSSLAKLDKQMQAVVWEAHELSSTKMDQRLHKEIQQWKKACQDWLEEQDGTLLIKLKGEELARHFIENLEQLKKIIGQVAVENNAA